MRKCSALAIVPLLYLAFFTSAFCQEQANAVKVKIITGRVVDVDWVTSQFTVRYYDDRPGRGFDELSFTVTSDTKVTKGTEQVEFGDMGQGDQVTVEYVDNALAGLQAMSIVLMI